MSAQPAKQFALSKFWNAEHFGYTLFKSDFCNLQICKVKANKSAPNHLIDHLNDSLNHPNDWGLILIIAPTLNHFAVFSSFRLNQYPSTLELASQNDLAISPVGKQTFFKQILYLHFEWIPIIGNFRISIGVQPDNYVDEVAIC